MVHYLLVKVSLKKEFHKYLSAIVLCLLFGLFFYSPIANAQTESKSLFGLTSPEIVINESEFTAGEKVEITIQKMPQIPSNTDPRLELYVYLPFLQKIGTNVPLNCLGEHCIVVYSFDEIRNKETYPKTLSFVLFSEKNPKPIVESGWMNSVCDLKINEKTVERYGNVCNSADLPFGTYEIKFAWGIEMSDKFEVFKTIPITVKEYSNNQLETQNQISGKSLGEDLIDKGLEKTKEVINIGSEIGKDAVGKSTEVGKIVVEKGSEAGQVVVEKSSEAVQEIGETASSSGGGCLIATASYGSELAPQIQQLRELRDFKLLQTGVGTSFMNEFNSFYYSFSPTIADLERQNPIFKEIVKGAITPMIASFSLLNYVNMESEEEVLSYGIGIILMNIGIYFIIPAIIIYRIQILRSR